MVAKGFSEETERCVAIHSVLSRSFWKRLGRFVPPSDLRNPVAKLVLQIAKEVAQDHDVPSSLLVEQRAFAWNNDGKVSDDDITAIVDLLQSYGTAKVLSSPRLSVMNNQTALLKVVENFVYFNVKADTTSTANVGTTVAVTTTPQSVSVGLVMTVTAQVSDGEAVPAVVHAQRLVSLAHQCVVP